MEPSETLLSKSHSHEKTSPRGRLGTLSSDDAPELSIVVPLYNEEDVFDELVRRLQATLEGIPDPCEIILVDDGSSDTTRCKIESICRRDSRFKGVLLSRNFGQQSAITAGLDHARGSCVGVLDADLQDPPELLPKFHEKLREGYDVAYAVRQKRSEPILLRACYWLFYRVLRSLANIQIPLDSGDFCLMRRRVVDQMRRMPERHRFLRGMRSWVGFRQIGVPYERPHRQAGEPKYSLRRLLALAIDGIVTFSEAPLRLATLSGICVSALAFVWGLYILVWRLVAGPASVPGFATLACGIFFLGGIQLLTIGILGEYIARIHNEVKGRPLYIVDSSIDSDAREQAPTC